MSEYVNATSVSCYTRLCAHGARTSRTNDYVTLVTRIESSRAVICNVTLRKSQERKGGEGGGEGADLGALSPVSLGHPRVQPPCCVSSRLMVLVSLIVDSLCAEQICIYWFRGEQRRKGAKDRERNSTLSRSLGPERKGLPVFQPSQKPSSDRSAFHVRRY